VIAVYKDNVSSKSYVYDLDTTLGFPETFEVYLDKALVELPNIKNKYKRYAPCFLNYGFNQFSQFLKFESF
jgi:hypothetical protein